MRRVTSSVQSEFLDASFQSITFSKLKLSLHRASPGQMSQKRLPTLFWQTTISLASSRPSCGAETSTTASQSSCSFNWPSTSSPSSSHSSGLASFRRENLLQFQIKEHFKSGLELDSYDLLICTHFNPLRPTAIQKLLEMIGRVCLYPRLLIANCSRLGHKPDCRLGWLDLSIY